MSLEKQRTIQNVKTDAFEKFFKDKFKTHIGLEFIDSIDWGIKKIKNKDIFVIDCQKSSKAVFVDKKTFFIRTSPATEILQGNPMIQYINNHFKKQEEMLTITFCM